MEDEKPKSPADVTSNAFFGSSYRPKGKGTEYSSAGGGEVYFNPADLWTYVWRYVRDEGVRQDSSGVSMVGPDLRSRPPQWLEDKNVTIDGTPLSDEEIRAPNYWQAKYKRELDVGEAIQEVKRRKRMEATHDVIGSISWVRRKLGLAEPLDEEFSRQKVETYYQQLERNNSSSSSSRTATEDAEEQKAVRKLGLTTPWKVGTTR
ncbi:hypothetical protein DQ04_03211040 [Trypanosoma grayi]|uniref:hypothetical protein n=1 Tax=Trypanosoma grayi TaxID=71804 RepID=UPI0004F46940|nr:hypothetical protein DQ04_03211040 [Trypanosoma grayi]KEG10860.1 hypothetical protein DQ04_03211040 [Trypanosoma grayi]